MSGFITYAIRDIGRVVTGKTPSTADQANFGLDFPFLTPTDMQGQKWARRTERGISAAGARKLRTLVPEGAVAVSCIGWQMGKAILIDRPTYTNQQINTIIPSALADSGYLYYHFATRRDELLSIASAGGVRTPIISKSSFEALKVALPPLAVQRRIASILSAYDDLIENNTRRIAILEEMARRIYEEWFIYFRFPGHENVRMVESELGPVPEGWTVEGLNEVATLTYGFPFKSRLFEDDANGVGVVRIRDIKSDRASTRTIEIADQKYRIADGDILIGMDGEFHMGRWAGGDAWLNQRVVRLRPMDYTSRSWLFWVTERPIKHLEATIVGTTVAHLSAGDLKAMRLLRPNAEIVRQAASMLDPPFDLELILKRKNANLRATRDQLLPKLISGELDVSSLPEPKAAVA